MKKEREKEMREKEEKKEARKGNNRSRKTSKQAIKFRGNVSLQKAMGTSRGA